MLRPTPLVAKIKASGNMKMQTGSLGSINKKHTGSKAISTKTTRKGKSLTRVSINGMPNSIEPIKAPRSKTLAQIGRSIRND